MSGPPVRIGIAGAAGRMGRALVGAAAEDPGITLAAALEAPGHDAIGTDAGTLAGVGPLGVEVAAAAHEAARALDVLVDFTTPEATVAHAAACAASGCRMVVGTTGLAPEQREELARAAGAVAVVHSPNMSVGVNVCFRLIEVALGALGDEVDVEIIEAHHRHKVDAPSGTAVRMGEIAAAVLGRDLGQCAVYGRQGRTGPRDRATIGFETIRAGDIVGEHTVLLAGTGERVEITHRAASRANFAHGAMRAARWVAGRAPGLYDMRDVLGLR